MLHDALILNTGKGSELCEKPLLTIVKQKRTVNRRLIILNPKNTSFILKIDLLNKIKRFDFIPYFDVANPKGLNMKRLFLCFSMFLVLTLTGQTEEKVKYAETAALIQKEYNAQNYKAIYKLTGKEFKSQMNEKEFGDVLRLNVQDIYGPILNLTYLESKEGIYTFLADCK